MTKRIFRSINIVALGVFFASVVLFMGALYSYFTGVCQNQLKMQTDLAAQGVANEGMDFFDNLPIEDYRITWIAPDGSILFDSSIATTEMENHLEREEIQMALSEGYGESSRYSSTLMERSLYAAKQLPDGSVLRLSVAQNTIFTLSLGMAQPLCIVLAIAIVLSLVLAFRLSKRIVKPLNELDLDDPLSNDGYDELSPLLRRIASQQDQIKMQTGQLRQKQLEFETVTSGMNEGIILLNKKGEVLSLNRAAARLLETDGQCVGKDILSLNRSFALQNILSKAEKGFFSEGKVALSGGEYQFDASPVKTENDISGIVLLIFDITEKEKAEQMRREFTANVSHELKTPLQTISGCAELLKNNMVAAEDVPAFSEKIYAEAGRMITLVEDIIKLSHLDEGAQDMQRETADLFEIAKNTVRTLTDAAKAAGVSLDITGSAAPVYGIAQLLQGIVYNLCDNAIKYNVAGGSVSVDVHEEKSAVVLTVSDTGIGIPPEHRDRIFERFYRVDKSHSKEVGGTGLGLSIVKHAAKLHDAKITVSSVIGAGTTMKVEFPKQENSRPL